MPESVTYDAANRWLASRKNAPTSKKSLEISAMIQPKVRAHSFFSATVADERVLARIRDVSDRYSAGEIGLAEARGELKKMFATDGALIHDGTKGSTPPPGVSEAEWSRAARITSLGSTARLNLILRQNKAMAEAVGQYEVGRDPDIETRWPCWRYIARSDARESHAAHHNMVYRKSDPIWRRIFPPWEFNCRCQVEDCDEEEAKQYGGVIESKGLPPLPESGFEFDPAHAFEVLSPADIDDAWARLNALESLEIELGDQIHGDGANCIITPRQYASWQERDLSDAKEWDKPAPAPEQLAPDEARKRLESGVKLTDPDGREVVLDREVIRHWEKDGINPKLQSDIDGRLSFLPYAEATVTAPVERWEQDTQSLYLGQFKKGEKRFRYCMVVVTNDGKARTYMIKDANSLNKARKGKDVKKY